MMDIISFLKVFLKFTSEVIIDWIILRGKVFYYNFNLFLIYVTIQILFLLGPTFITCAFQSNLWTISKCQIYWHIVHVTLIILHPSVVCRICRAILLSSLKLVIFFIIFFFPVQFSFSVFSLIDIVKNTFDFIKFSFPFFFHCLLF